MRQEEEEDKDVAAAAAAPPPPPRSRSQCSGSRRVAPASGDLTAVEKALPNGDLYRGGFSSNAPHGHGKYLWSDGCMYEGEWRRGKASGKGKFSWPSGATYEGEFRSGRMEGIGTFTGADGDTYTGAWIADRKHGNGRKCYANGDSYEGAWRRNLQDGHGRYTWRSGNQYIGEWRNGVISGRGVLVWANGNRYEGSFDNGVPKGNGVFTSAASDDAIPVKRASSVEKNFPKICIWEADGEAGDITCDIVDTLEVYKDSSSFEQADAAPRRKNPCCFGEAKKPGQTISKGHKNYDLMINLQLGIRYSIGKLAAMQMRDLRDGDFDPKEKFWTRFPTDGSKFTPPHQSSEFRWKDYCPMVFRHLRKLFAVDPADYMMAICGNDALRELSSPGKSGCFFYLTQDDRFMIKTVKKCEVKVLIRMLRSYYQHVYKYKNTLVTKFFGVHCVKPVGGQKVRFIVMGNLFCSEYPIHRRFDLKGSSHGRTTDKAASEIDETTTLKDLDLNFVFRLQTSWFKELIEQIDRDCEFLEAERIMDYSLLVGIHFHDVSASKRRLTRSDSFPRYYGKSSFEGGGGFSELLLSECGLLDMDRVMESRKPIVRLGANLPARAEPVCRSNGHDPLIAPTARMGEIYDTVLNFGVIDILQDYDISKKLEHAYKSLHVDPTSISAVDPKLYSRRFRDFISKIFIEDTTEGD